jgi:hypothetical protein
MLKKPVEHFAWGYTSKCIKAIPDKDLNPGCRRANTLL